MSSASDEKISPVDPKRFHLALGLYQAALAEESLQADASRTSSNFLATDSNPFAADSAALSERAVHRAMLAVKKQFPDQQEFQSLSQRLQRFAEVIGDKKLIDWGMIKYSQIGGVEIHDAVINALATAPIRKSGVLDKPAFHSLVKAEYTRLEDGGAA